MIDSQGEEAMDEQDRTDGENEQAVTSCEIDRTSALTPAMGGAAPSPSWLDSVFPRLLIGLIVLISTEVFSGASLKIGLWHPWTLLVTFWLYFAHFFLFTTLAVWTGRTSFWSLYLWGVLFGLYESWITKVIWFGYGGDGKFVLGNLGPYGFSEISMVFIFHPMMALIFPLAVLCILCPSLRRWFPELAWFTGKSRGARVVRIYLVLVFGTIVAANSGGATNLALNLAFVVSLLMLLLRFSRFRLDGSDGRSLVVFGPLGFATLCVYLLLLYGVTYVHLRPEGLPSLAIQSITLAFYALAIVGLWLHRRRQPPASGQVTVDRRESRVVVTLVALVFGLGFLLSIFSNTPMLFLPVVVSFVIWTPLGLLLTMLALARGVRERFAKQ